MAHHSNSTVMLNAWMKVGFFGQGICGLKIQTCGLSLSFAGGKCDVHDDCDCLPAHTSQQYPKCKIFCTDHEWKSPRSTQGSGDHQTCQHPQDPPRLPPELSAQAGLVLSVQTVAF